MVKQNRVTIPSQSHKSLKPQRLNQGDNNETENQKWNPLPTHLAIGTEVERKAFLL